MLQKETQSLLKEPQGLGEPYILLYIEHLPDSLWDTRNEQQGTAERETEQNKHKGTIGFRV